MADCTTCGKSLRDVARFCPDCGTPVVHAPATAATTAHTSDPAAVPAASVPEPAAEPTADPAAGPPAGAETEPAAVVAAEPAIAPPAVLATAVVAAVRCQTCGTVVPEGDLFCGDCGAPIAGAAAAAGESAQALQNALPAAAATMYAPQPTQPQPAAPSGAAPVYQPPHVAGHPRVAGGGSSFADYLSFSALFTGDFAVAVFWVAEGVNVLYWILNWVNHRYSGAEAFLWSAAGFVLFAVIIRILVEAAVSAGRVNDEIAALREDGGRR